MTYAFTHMENFLLQLLLLFLGFGPQNWHLGPRTGIWVARRGGGWMDGWGRKFPYIWKLPLQLQAQPTKAGHGYRWPSNAFATIIQIMQNGQIRNNPPRISKISMILGFDNLFNLILFCLRSYEHRAHVKKETTLLSIQVIARLRNGQSVPILL